jgi:hypothetical protein
MPDADAGASVTLDVQRYGPSAWSVTLRGVSPHPRLVLDRIESIDEAMRVVEAIRGARVIVLPPLGREAACMGRRA